MENLATLKNYEITALKLKPGEAVNLNNYQ